MKKKIFAELLSGHAIIVITAVIYSIAWTLNYGNGKISEPVLISVLINISLLAGICGAFISILSAGDIYRSLSLSRLRIRYFIAGGLALFILTDLTTFYGFGRMLTSELILIFIWGTIEACTLTGMIHQRLFSKPQVFFTLLFFILSFLTSLFCYTIHYTLSGFASYINGLIPYWAISFYMAVFCIFVLSNRKKYAV